jgi:hypothetical protein
MTTTQQDTHWTVNHVLNRLGRPGTNALPVPLYTYREGGTRVGLAVASMRDHTSDEGWKLFEGLEHAGYFLHGHGIDPSLTSVREILRRDNPSVVVVQDQREWEGQTAGPGFDTRETFRNVHALAHRPDTFRVGVLKDAHQKTDYHRASFESFGAHAFVCYYHPRIVAQLAPYVRPQHLIRTYHCIDPAHLPPWNPALKRHQGVITGALSNAYPLRQRLFRAAEAGEIPCQAVRHPGYHRNGCHTPEYMGRLSLYKVSVCTSSIYGYALRKLVESTAVGCRVITDLPEDEIMPAIDKNLVRIRPDTPVRHVGEVIHDLIHSYDEELQKNFAAAAVEFYDFRTAGTRLAQDIDTMRASYQ